MFHVKHKNHALNKGKKMSGTLVNFVAIIAGSVIGLVLKDKFPDKIQETIMKGLSLAVILIGLQMALETDYILIVIFSLVLGGIIGEVIALEERLQQLGEYFKRKIKRENDLFIQGFVQASLVFCVGAMAIMGAIQDGLSNNPTILFNKSLLDGVASIAFSATFGVGVLFSAIPVLVYQGGIALFASFLQKYLSDVVINEMTATGGLLILAIGLNIMGISKIRAGNLLPSLVVAILLVIIFV